MYELTTFKIPFHQLKFNSQVQDAIAEGKRPELLDKDQPDGWRKLITLCWDQDATIRPTAGVVVQELETILTQLKRSTRLLSEPVLPSRREKKATRACRTIV